jgi:Na+/H+-translocating membrane pyrophosphatase
MLDDKIATRGAQQFGALFLAFVVLGLCALCAAGVGMQAALPAAQPAADQFSESMQAVQQVDPVAGPIAGDLVSGICLVALLLPAIVVLSWVYHFFAKWHPQPK